MTGMTMSGRNAGAWLRIAFAMFAVGWGANQFSPMLIVYRHELRLTAGEVAGLFLVYALTLIPGLLVGGPASDRFGRRPVVWPFVALSPLATLLLVLGPRSLPLIATDPLVVPYLPHLVIGTTAAVALAGTPERTAGPDERGAVIACYYALAYVGFAVPYLAAGLGVLAGKSGAFVALTAIVTVLALWTAGYAASLRRASRVPEGDAIVRWSGGHCDSVSR
jgi:MFS family permease